MPASLEQRKDKQMPQDPLDQASEEPTTPYEKLSTIASAHVMGGLIKDFCSELSHQDMAVELLNQMTGEQLIDRLFKARKIHDLLNWYPPAAEGH